MRHRCPICRKVIATAPDGKPQESEYFPFCSARCKLIDLGAWFDAEYKVLNKPEDQDSDISDIEK